MLSFLYKAAIYFGDCDATASQTENRSIGWFPLIIRVQASVDDGPVDDQMLAKTFDDSMFSCIIELFVNK